MKKINIIVPFLIMALPMLGQHTVEGVVQDGQGQILAGATVMLLMEADSSMLAFAISNANGRFRLEDAPKGKQLIQYSYLGYDNLEMPLEIAEADPKTIVLEAVKLQESTAILKEVEVSAERIPMGIRGDTISYDARAFTTRPGANVEELLKKLPGVEVDRSGNIKAQGETVENVLVDGKEFFGDDPLVATRNLEAEAVDKVEVFDKKSDIAEFTGIDDGQEEKTINLKLKEEHKKGGFGKATVQGGTEDTWLGKINYNRFTPKLQAAIIFSANNINQQSFSMNEYISFMGGLGNAISNSSTGVFSFGQQFSGNNRGQEGINKNYSGGANLNYDFSDKLQFFSNYFYLSNNNSLVKTITSDNFIPGQTYQSEDDITSRFTDQNFRLNTKFIYKINPFNELVLKNSWQGVASFGAQESLTLYTDQAGSTSSTFSDYFKDLSQRGWESELQYRRKFQKKGRNWISTVAYKQARQNDSLYVKNNTFLNEIPQEYVYQFQHLENDPEELKLTTNYTEPIGKRLYLGISYNYTLNKEQPDKDFFDRWNEDMLELDESLSSYFERSSSFHRPGVSLRKNTKKFKINAGLRFQKTLINGILNDDELTVDAEFEHFLPSLSIDYDVKSSQGLNFNYITSVRPPGLLQLMPIVDNSDPNISRIGNPRLRPEYEHRTSLSYNLYDQFNFVNFYARVGMQYAIDRVVNRATFNDDLTRTIIPVNSKRYWGVDGYINYSTPIRPLKINWSLSMDVNTNKYESFINDFENEVTESTMNWTLKIHNRKKEKVDVGIGVRWNYNVRNFSINDEFNQSFYNYDGFAEGDWFITEKLTFSASYDYINYASTVFSSGSNFHLINLSLEQYVFGERLMISLMAHDLLNQNRGFHRSGSYNSLQESNYNTLGQYFMAGLSLKLSKQKEPEGMIKFSE